MLSLLIEQQNQGMSSLKLNLLEHPAKRISVNNAKTILEIGKSEILKKFSHSVWCHNRYEAKNGNRLGDRYVIRGHEARSDIFCRGLRGPRHDNP